MRRFAALLLPLALAACASGGRTRVSEPAASIQELAVDARGAWQVRLRLQNYSSVPMHFNTADLALTIDGQDAGRLATSPGFDIPPESADTVTLAHQPSANARLALTDALAARRSVRYVLDGTVTAAAQGRKPEGYSIRAESQLSPVPGLPGTLR